MRSPLPLYGLATLAACMLAVYTDYAFVADLQAASNPDAGPRDPGYVPNRGVDGFAYQYLRVQGTLASGSWHTFVQYPNMLLHLIRYLVCVPFVAAGGLFGPVAPILMLSLAAVPLIRAFSPPASALERLVWLARAALPLLFVVLSGRSILVGIGMGYTVWALTSPRPRGRPLAAGVALSIFSTASIVITGLVIGLDYLLKRRSKIQVVAVIVLVAFMVPSAMNKFIGFSGGDAGFQSFEEATTSQVEQSAPCEGKHCVVERILTRSTIYTSWVFDQHSRFALYVVLLVAGLGALTLDAIRRRPHPMALSIAVGLLGLAVEGLGAWTLLFPLIWRYSWHPGIDSSHTDAASEPSPEPL